MHLFYNCDLKKFATDYMWLLSIWNVVSVTEEMIVDLTNFSLN